MHIKIEEKEDNCVNLDEETVDVELKDESLLQKGFSRQVSANTTCSSQKRRTLYKSGRCNARGKNRPHGELMIHMQDVFTSLVESRWRVTLLVFASSFLLTWFLFGCLWWVVAHEHNDLGWQDDYDPQREPCVTEMTDFISCFLFSMETQYSTGYGTRSPTTTCPEAIALLVLQSIFGVLIQSTMAGIVFAKLSRPKARSQHIVFSKKAVVCVRDGYLSLMFRVGDFRKSHIIGAMLRAWLLQHRVSPEGELLPHYQHKLQLSIDSGGSDAFLIWPSTVFHRIDVSSPLYDLSAMDTLNANFEIVVVLNGTVEATGQSAEARTSYLPSEVLWGHRFKQLIKFYRKRRYDFAVDYSRFDETYPVDTPLCSARSLSQWNLPHSPVTPVLPSSSSSFIFSYKTL